MKISKYNIALVTGLTLWFSTGCEDFYEEKIGSPNDPTQVSPDLILTSAQVATFASYGGQLARQSNILTQHIAGTSAGSQTIEIANYNLTELTNVNEWEVIYTDIVVETDIIIRDFGADNPHYMGMAKVLRAMALGLATDLWGDVPASNASSGLDNNFNPSYDLQEDLYDENSVNSLFALLDDAIADLSAPAENNAQFPASDDLLYGGDVGQWITLAHSLKARYYNHLSERDPQGSASATIAALANAISSPSDNAIMAFGTNGNEQNQWYAYNLARGDYIKMGEYFVDSLKAMGDPRLSFYADTASNGAYVGTPKDDVDSINTSNIGSYLNSLGAQIPLVSFVEMKFIEAEAQLRNGNNQGAADAYNEAVIASVTEVTGSAPGATYVSNYASATASDITLEAIMMQKYIAMFGQVEAYSDFRRTGLPALAPNSSASRPSIPLRFIYPQDERLYNANFPGTKQLNESVWWDN